MYIFITLLLRNYTYSFDRESAYIHRVREMYTKIVHIVQLINPI